jgi:signal transduction histidine kinase
VPSAEIAPVNIMIPPTFVQSATFRIIIAITVLTLMILGLALWHRGLTRRLRTQIEERLRERERVARDLHDTLLQGFQGIVLRFQALAMGIAPQTGVPERINTILCDADGVMAEARSQVRDLRGGNGATDLTARFAAIAGERVTDIPVSIHTEGRVRELHPIVRNEIFRIGREATLNAISHSAASEILITLVYRSSFFAVDVSDDGIGIDHRLMTHGRDGHFGLATMRERAKQIGADLELTSPPGRGTHLTLRIPARIAYRRPPLLAIAWPWNRRASDAA